MPAPREPGRPRKRPEAMPGGWLWILFLLLLLVAIVSAVNIPQGGEITYGQFIDVAKPANFERITIVGEERLVGKVKEKNELPEEIKKLGRGGQLQATIPVSERKEVYKTLKAADFPTKDIITQPEPMAWVGPFFMFVFPTILLIGFFLFFILPRIRDPLSGGMFNSYIKSPAKKFDKGKQRTTFADVADMANAKSELQEIVEFLKNPEKFARLGAQIPKGVLLVGLPGTGKTLLARAVAGEAGVPFFSSNGSEFIQMFVGVGASRVRDMFKTAKDAAPCLLFIDEIDAVGRMRGAGVGGGSDEREQTLNQILGEMDGFTPNESVIVLAATNRPDVLDPALLRPGRFDRTITVDRPTWQGRLEILKVHTRNKPLADDVNLEQIARKSMGMTGADLRNLANEAALLATRENKNRIETIDFERAADRVLLGAKREEVFNEEHKRRTGYHEAGHAIVGWYMPAGDVPTKVSIIPRGRTGGVTWFEPEEEENFHRGLDYFKATLAKCMGGRAAERLKFNQPFTGVEQDLKQATRMARYMVTHWGMSDRLGPMSFRIGEEHVFLGKEITEQRDFSDQMAWIIDEEVQKLLREADETAFRILDEHRDQLEEMVKQLLDKEELLKDDIQAILGKRGTPVEGNGKPVEAGFTVDPASRNPI